MKRRITMEQLNELTEIQKEKLREWWIPEDGDYYIYYLKSTNYQDMVRAIKGFLLESDVLKIYKENKLPLLDTTQMISLITEIIKTINVHYTFNIGILDDKYYCKVGSYGNKAVNYPDLSKRCEYSCINLNKSDKELCDALWFILKELL